MEVSSVLHVQYVHGNLDHRTCQHETSIHWQLYTWWKMIRAMAMTKGAYTHTCLMKEHLMPQRLTSAYVCSMPLCRANGLWWGVLVACSACMSCARTHIHRIRCAHAWAGPVASGHLAVHSCMPRSVVAQSQEPCRVTASGINSQLTVHLGSTVGY